MNRTAIMKQLTALITYLGSFTLALLFFCLPQSHAAGSIYVTPGSSSVAPGGTLTISVRENSGADAVNAVQANLSYPTDKLTFLSVNGGGSAFSIDANSGGGAGGVSIARGSLGAGVTGDKYIASVSFRVIGSTGTATISVAGSSALVRGSDQANVFSGGASGNYTITTATTNGSGSSPTPVASAAPLTISEVTVSAVATNSALISWKTNNPATSLVAYGTDTTYGLTAQSDTPSTDHAVTLESPLFQPATTYHFIIKSTDANNQTASSQDQSFQTLGYAVTLTIKDSNGQAVTEAQVIGPDGSDKKYTNQNGSVTFTNLKPGKQLFAVTANGETQTYTVTIAPNGETTGQQALTFAATSGGSSSTFSGLQMAIIGSIILLIVLIGVITLIIRGRKKAVKQDLPSLHHEPQIIPSPSPTSE